MKENILVFVYKRGEVRFKDFIDHFVKGGRCSRSTLLKYKCGLEGEGKLKKKISEKTGRPVYYLSDEASSEAQVYMSAETMTSTSPKTFKRLPKVFFQPIHMIEETLGLEKMECVFSGYTGLRRFLAEPAFHAISESTSGFILSDLEIDESYLSKAALELVREYHELVNPLVDRRMYEVCPDLASVLGEVAGGTNVRGDMAKLFRRLHKRFGLEEIQDILTGEKLSSELSSTEKHLICVRLKRLVMEWVERYSKWMSEQKGFRFHVMLSFDGSLMLKKLSNALEKTPEDTWLREVLRWFCLYLTDTGSSRQSSPTATSV